MPIMVGNCVHNKACLELMRTGISGILIGVGPGAACTTRIKTGIGAPNLSAVYR
ncbi:MAG: IMP dehydrogenase, partial [Candidatus Thorarchaeota archaeon]